MQVALGSIMHESNSFSPISTSLSAFEDTELLFGDELIERHTPRKTELGGILHVAQQRNIEIIPTVSAKAMPSGPVTTEAFTFLMAKLLEGIHAAGQVDSVILALHGAMLTTDCDDPEGLILQQVRDVVGREVPVGLTLDHHANVTALMAEQADFMISYRTHPHVDHFQVGKQAAELIGRMVKEGLRPAMRTKKVPVLIPVESSPQARSHLVRRIEELESKASVLSASFFIGYAFADVEEMGPCAVVITDNDECLSEYETADFANLMWSLRDDFAIPVPTIEQAFEEAMTSKAGPFVLCDLGDCLMAGGTGDTTAFLAAILQKRVDSACLTLIDPEAVKQCIAAGVGRQTTVTLGGKIDPASSQPVTVTARVGLVSDGLYRGKGYDLAETEINMGRTVVLQIGDVDVVVTERRCPVHDPALYRSLGIQPEQKKIVVVKDAFNATMTYKPIAQKIIFLNSPGVCNWDFKPSQYHRIQRPVYPFDKLSFDAHASSD